MSETAVSHAAASARKPKGYSLEFEAVWKAYPTDPNMSKTKAFAAWSKLDAEDRGKVASAIPGFIAYCRKDPSYRPVHMVRFITDRRFDGHLAEAEPAAVDWSRRLAYARSTRMWSTPQWGPRPGLHDCAVPTELLVSGDGEGWSEPVLRAVG